LVFMVYTVNKTMRKTILLLLLAALCFNANGQNTKQGQRKDTMMAQPHNPPRHRHTDDTNKPKQDTTKGKLNKEKNQGNVPQPDKQN